MALDWSYDIKFLPRGIKAGPIKIFSRSQDFGFTSEIDHKHINLQLSARRVVGVYWKIKLILSFSISGF